MLSAADYRSGVQAAVLGKAAERTNVFVMTGSADTVISWRYRDPSGAVRGTVTRTYLHDATFQFPASDLVGGTPAPNGTLEATVESGAARVALSPVNNTSNQGRWVDFKVVQ